MRRVVKCRISYNGIGADTKRRTVFPHSSKIGAKAVCPAIITDNSEITYTLIVQNLGNTAIVATDGVIVSDVFNPVLSNITVALNGEPIEEGTGYTYDKTTGAFATLDGIVTVPAAAYARDPITGAITTTPGVTVITITGTV